VIVVIVTKQIFLFVILSKSTHSYTEFDSALL
jgi:hypothetical protein